MKVDSRFRDLAPHRKVLLVALAVLVSCGAVLVVAVSSMHRVGAPVTTMQAQVQPARDNLLAVQQGLGATQSKFINLMTEPDHVKRVLYLEEVRRQLSLNDDNWRAFEARSLQLPGERALWDRYDALTAELQRLEGPVGLLMINAEDTAPLWYDPNFVRLRQIQQEAIDVTGELDRDFYAPLATEQISQAASAGDDGVRNIWLVFATMIAVAVPVSMIAYGSARRAERTRRADQAHRSEEARRSKLEAQLNRAFEMAGSESGAYAIVEQALQENLGDQPAELLIADSSVAHFRRVLTTDPAGRKPGCGVVSPSECPASHRGDTLVFAHSQDLDSCPYLRDRDGDRCGAVCQPVSVAGKSIGVIHTTMAEGQVPAKVLVDLDLIARRAGERIGMLRAFAESENQARTDPLTGLLNRRSLENSIRRMIEAGSPYCVAYGDLDHFKRLNDTHGHTVGDRALRAFAAAVIEMVRPADLACRYGGEEFVLVLPDCEVEEAVMVVERVRSGLAEMLRGTRLPLFTVSFGVASSGQADSFERVVGLADAALLQAKSSGRDRVVVAGWGPAELLPGPRAQLGPGTPNA